MAWRNPWYSDKQPEDPFVDKMQYDTLKEKGFHYNEDEDHWERVWVVATRDGSERSKEVYKKEGDDWRGDHAGKWETSILMALYPDLVDISLLPKNKDAELIGIIGEDPRRSTLEFGKRAIKLILNEMVEKGKQLVKEAETG